MFKNVVFTALCVLLSSTIFGQFSITGTVKDVLGEPLISASVIIEGSQKGTITNINGKFVINELKADSYLIKVSYLGYEPHRETVVITSQNIDLQSIILRENTNKFDILVVTPIIVASPLRANTKTPMTYYNMSKEELEANNLGQDVPYLLQMTPSTVVTSDGGIGIGYTGIRIRGTDPSRINVTVNGIPVNDAESQNVFWVDLPDFASSTGSVQIQRGVGTSTNGAGAFGGTINMETNRSKIKPFVGINTSIGSFNTLKTNLSFDSGLLGSFNINGRVSLINSDGYVDRATANLWSYQLSAKYTSGKNSIEFVNFHGKEVTYQAWYGVDLATLETDRTINYAGMEADPPYENQVDDYQQTYYQLLYKHRFGNLYFDGALHYTRGKGFYEEYKAGQNPTYYNLIAKGFVNDTVATTDLVRRRWLDNHFYGATYGFTYIANDKAKFIIGGAANNYTGKHFGQTIWANAATNNEDLAEAAPTYYEGTGDKFDFNTYAKVNYQLNKQLNVFADVQYRFVSHDIAGIDNDKRVITQSHSFNFFNPKAGFTFQQNNLSSWYASYSMANREPNRGDFTDAPTTAIPTPERLHDVELGNRLTANNWSWNTNIYYMRYDNQLVLTGQINDVGAPIRVNVDNSYRLGLELVGGVKPTKWLELRANATFSQNKIKHFVEYVDDWDNGGQITIQHGKTDIAFSPNILAAGELILKPFTNKEYDLELALMSKYVGKQFIDNTSVATSTLDAFWINDVRLSFGLKQDWAKNIRLTFLTRNVFNELYESNAWIYRYNFNGQIQQYEGLYPQAGRHFFLGLDLKF